MIDKLDFRLRCLQKKCKEQTKLIDDFSFSSEDLESIDAACETTNNVTGAGSKS
jgi:hypothetical protein